MTMAQLRREATPLLCLLVFALCWFGAIELLFPRYFLWDDNATFFLPIYFFNYDTLLREHTLPIINFFQLAGWNHLHAGQTGVLYPPAYLALWIANLLFRSPLNAIDILVTLHLVAGMFGMYGWLRTLGSERALAASGAALYGTLPFATILSRSWVFVSYAHCYTPLCFLLLECLLRKRNTWGFLGYIMAKTLFALQGYEQYVVYLTLFEMLYISLLHSNKHVLVKSWTTYLCANASAALLSLPLLLPMAEATFQSQERSLPLSLKKSMELYGLLQDILLDQVPFLSEQRSYYWQRNIFHVGGSIFLPWIVYRVVSARKALPAVCIKSMVICLVALCLSSSLYIALACLPLLSRFRWPFKIFLFFGLFYTLTLILTLGWAHRQRVISRNVIVLMWSLAFITHAAVLTSPPIGDQSLSSMKAPIDELYDTRFRSIAASSYANLPPSVCEKLPAFNYPSAWKVASMSGYDPLISRTHTKIRTEHATLGLYDPELVAESIDHFSRWSVRYIVAREPLPEKIRAQSGLQKIASQSPVVVYENPHGYPIAAFVDSPREPLDVEYRANRIHIATNGQTGEVLVRVAPLESLHVQAPSQKSLPTQHTENGIIATVDDPYDAIDVVYRSKTFEWGLACAATTLSILGCALGLRAARQQFATYPSRSWWNIL